MNQHFVVKITEVTERLVPAQQWMKVADTGNERDNGPVYAYVDTETRSTEKRVLLKQDLEAIALPAIIKAINQL